MRTKKLPTLAGAIALSVFGLGAQAGEEESVKVTLKAPMLVCHEQAGGARPPDAKAAEAEHDLIFFVVAGRDSEGKEIHEALPKGGSYLKIDTQRASKIVKNTAIWDGTIKPGQSVSLVLSVREQDGQDSSEADAKEAFEIARLVDHSKPLKELARIPVHEVLHDKKGENDHLGTVVIRLTNVKGKVKFETEPGADAKYLKGHDSTEVAKRAFQFNGDHGHYDLHLSLGVE